MTALAEIADKARSGDPAAHYELARAAMVRRDDGGPFFWAAIHAAKEAMQGGMAEAVHIAAEASWWEMLLDHDDDEARAECIRWHALAVRTGNDPDAKRWTETQQRIGALVALFDIEAADFERAARELWTRLYAPSRAVRVN